MLLVAEPSLQPLGFVSFLFICLFVLNNSSHVFLETINRGSDRNRNYNLVVHANNLGTWKWRQKDQEF